MPTIYIQIQAPIADVAAIEADLSPYGDYLLAAPITTYPGPQDGPITNYGCNLSCVMGSAIDTFIQTLPSTYPNCVIQTVQRTAPYYKAYNSLIHWVAWLNSQGLQPQIAYG